ncbi:ABC transporter ATP-binding protein [Hoyosella subflava]|uniref:Trehalose import ATP-binding protein SugC n=1 Tax=Hoyosella subflava (strain DSM 45089 / JCM 17490 / NBRC 109087 / DQS3-9A1) TaxID=443218 RepID=F6EP32_HOYSD|nr:sn-glycerol-3-phosphate ABC transporter ATP-binding protein UgpC [Hoyosella subflava]AEF40498.1 Putative ABC transporter ATP-binding protein [Hoyosella subflava DQS3-9A1]
MASITFAETTRVYPGSSVAAVDRLDLHIPDGEFLVLVGPSGCGKSTSLRMLAGLEEVDAGQIFIGDKDVTHLDPRDRDIAMVFQNYALYPHMSVAQNMGFALKLARTPKAEIESRVADAAELLGLSDFLDRKPKALSGGQRQRVAMGRAIVRQPQVFLMDEPLSNLDAKLRVQTRTQIAQLQRRLATTTVYVTHDQVEAMTMGDRVAVLNGGVLQQCDNPRELYRNPKNVFVAGFIGSPAMNLYTAPVSGGIVSLGDLALRVPRSAADEAGSELIVGIRPEHFEVSGAGLRVEVDVVEELGSEAFIYGRAMIGGREEQLVTRVDWRRPPAKGEVIYVTVTEEHVHFFATHGDGGRLPR